MDANGDDVIRTAGLLLGDRHGAEDISQDVFWTCSAAFIRSRITAACGHGS
ncbi:hypothetical protein WJ0W_005401 [Paenibacillus melissococcoides]|uniref:RNA polymerase sigma-70 region 2 domain-containing protein n=1 Tax=Paenibacillus melissococcoides TaxID=2912268 RepID=A0ABN8UAI2_9BACL|nr:MULTISPECIES: hypothetical protein [Paenibacillus]MEB9897614.1 hypothetical protein [Bacillus cereus]CAH8248146.1 hypothetical protein WJ0W_005401 [Paenibacillus melissococcoides]CAH8718336.1 hypothetical protein HTL2_005244 [Paenibacillus melissococcoides]CAH8718784.1 hypothetical protein WDD9_005330 [Paenibacillus melissococcoides]